MIDAITPPVSPVGSANPVSPTDLARGAAAAGAGPDAPAADFGAMLGQLAANASGALKTAEAMSITGIRGQASVQQVVEAVMQAEETLQGALAIRDKAVAAYLEISRMSI